jgi:hypothetical protein
MAKPSYSPKLDDPCFLRQWRRLVIHPRADIERHFAWIKCYFGLKYFQCFTFGQVLQFVLLTCIAALAVAMAAQRYECPDFLRSRSMVLAHVRFPGFRTVLIWIKIGLKLSLCLSIGEES